MEAITTNKAPRMMTIREIAATGVLPEHALRAGVKQGWVPHIKCGKKTLVNYDRLVAYLNGDGT